MMVIAPNFKPPQIHGMKYTTAYSSLQQAIDSLPEDPVSGGGVVYHPIGTMYETQGTIIPSHVTILGAGRESSIISYENYTQVPTCPECSAELPLIAFRCTYNDLTGGGAVIESGMRDLYLKASTNNTIHTAIGTHWLKTPGEPEVDTLMGGWRVQLENLDLRHFNRGLHFNPQGIYGLMGLCAFKHLKIINTNLHGILMQGDNRSNLYEDVHILGIREPWYGCAILQTHYSSSILKCVFESCYGTGLELSSWRGGTVHGTYFESNLTGLGLSNTTNAVDVAGTFMFGMGYSGFTIDGSVNNSIHDTVIQYGVPLTCVWRNQITGNRFYNTTHVLYSGSAYHDFGTGTDKASGSPSYIEDPNTNNPITGTHWGVI